MKKTILLLLIFHCHYTFAESTQAMLVESRTAIKTFSGELKDALQLAMKQDGVVSAIPTCQTSATTIADKVSQQYGWKISRTALKVRNPNNMPDSWEKEVLDNFSRRIAAGEEIASMEQHAIITSEKQKTFRYMQAIATGAICLSCHGENIAEPVASKIADLYPADQATGFKAGNLRGAFSIERKLD